MDAILSQLKRLTESQWAELRLLVGDKAAVLPAQHRSKTEQAVALTQLAAADSEIRARIDRFLGESRRLDWVLVFVEVVFSGLPERPISSLRHLRDPELHLPHIDPTRDPLVQFL